jgi:hypothetical protein
VAAVALCIAPAAHAAWPTQPTVDAPLAELAGLQGQSQVVSDGQGGFIAVWSDRRAGIGLYDVYAQRVDAQGNALWAMITADGGASHGVPVTTMIADAFEPQIVPDGAGGAIIVWHDTRNDSGDIYGQRIDSSGAPVWATDGIALTSTTGLQQAPAITPDGAGGVFLVYTHRPTASYDRVYAQHISAAGAQVWSGGVHVATGLTVEQRYPSVIRDGAGGIVVGFRTLLGNYDLRAQRLDGAGALQWTPSGVVVSDTNNGSGGTFVMGPDGAGGAVFAWTGDQNVYANRVGQAGILPWTSKVAICEAMGAQANVTGAPDGAGGLIVAWADPRHAPADTAVYAARITASGTAPWTADGVPVTVEHTYVPTPRVFAGDSGAFVLWRDTRSSSWALYAQHLGLDGAPSWVVNGVPVSENPRRGHYDWSGVADGTGGLFVSFTVGTSGVDTDIMTKRLAPDGTLGVAAATDGGAPDSGGGAGGATPVDAGADGAVRDGAVADAGSVTDSSTGGAPSEDGAPAAGGATGSGGATAGSGGAMASTGGRATSAGGGSDEPDAATPAPRKRPDSDGCDCRTAGHGAPTGGTGWVGLLFGLAFAAWRRGGRR